MNNINKETIYSSINTSIEELKKIILNLSEKYNINSLKTIWDTKSIEYEFIFTYGEKGDLIFVEIKNKTENLSSQGEKRIYSSSQKIPYWLGEVGNNKTKKLEEKIKYFKSSSFIHNGFYRNIFGGLSRQVLGFHKAIKDGFFSLNKGETLTSIHDILGKKADIYNFEFFTPEKTAKQIADKINHIANGEKILDIGSGLGQIIKYLKNGEGIELNDDYVEILTTEGYKVFRKDIEFDEMEEKYKYIIGNPPFGNQINKFLFEFIYKNSTDDMIGVLLLPINYDSWFEKYKFAVLDKEIISENFMNTDVKTAIYTFKKIKEI